MQAKQQTTQFYGIDFLRFFAALLVLIYHFGFVSWAAPGSDLNPAIRLYDGYRILAPFIGTGWVGVEIFFVISGFVIAYTANGASPFNFLNRRIRRLGPAVWICASLSLPVLLATGASLREALTRYFASLAFLPYVPKVSGSYWTLPVELAFYGLIFLLLCRDLFHRIERVTLLLGYGSVFLWVLYYLRPWLPIGGLRHVITLLGDKPAGDLLLTHYGVFFAVGLMIWLVNVYGWTISRVTALAAFVMAGVLEIAATTTKSSSWTGYHEWAAVPIALWLAAVISIMVSIKYNRHLVRYFNCRPNIVRTIGLVTYPLYLVHVPVGSWVQCKLLAFGCPPMSALVIAAGFSILLATIIATTLEPLLQKQVRKLLDRFEHRLPIVFDRLRLPTALAPSKSS
jgi:peptidoglycan/LPS O-acetylase OafA/YrhL